MKSVSKAKVTHLLTLSFDDGFRKSFTETARIYEEFGRKACLNVFTESCRPVFRKPDAGHNAPTGDWDLWNELAARGHEIMPHGYDHSNHRAIPFAESKWRIDACLEAFEENLKGFRRDEAVFNFPYNASSPEVEAYLSPLVRAFRTGGGELNPWPGPGTKKITTGGFGPGNCEGHLDGCVERFLAGAGGWMVYNLHGLDEEGWGPIRSDYLRRLLDRLVRREEVEILPAAAVLKK